MKKIFKRINVAENYEKVQENIPALVKTVFAALFIMALSTLAVFFIRVKGAEQTLVPNVVGIQLEDAIVELQVKQLYPKIKLRYTDDGVEKGVVLEQSPSARSMVKGYSTVTLTVSRGPVQATVEDYVGKNVKDLKIGDEQLAYGDNKSVLKFDSPIYKYDDSAEGTVLAQFPAPGLDVFQTTNVQLVVSKGAAKKNVEIPALYGMTIQDFFDKAQNTPLIFDVTAHVAAEGEVPGTITTNTSTGSVQEYSRIAVDFAFPEAPIITEDEEIAFGLIEEELADFPFPVKMELDAISTEGETTRVASFRHTGGKIAVPYAVAKGTTLVFTVNNKVATRFVVS